MKDADTWDSDLAEPAKHLIEVTEKWFEGSPSFLNDGTEYVPEPEHEEVQYTGEPSRQIDRNWELLHWGETLSDLPILILNYPP